MVPVSVEVLSRLFQHLALDEHGVVLPEAVGADNHGHRREGSENQDECPQDLSFHGLQITVCKMGSAKSKAGDRIAQVYQKKVERGAMREFFF
jgi:hypothetical protein